MIRTVHTFARARYHPEPPKIQNTFHYIYLRLLLLLSFAMMQMRNEWPSPANNCMVAEFNNLCARNENMAGITLCDNIIKRAILWVNVPVWNIRGM